jgi:hypothetical protein
VLFLAEQKHNSFWTKFCNFDHSGMCANFQGSSSKLNLQGSPADGCVALTRQDGTAHTARRGTARHGATHHSSLEMEMREKIVTESENQKPKMF